MKLKNKALFLDRVDLINKKWNIDQNKNFITGDKKIKQITQIVIHYIFKKLNLRYNF